MTDTYEDIERARQRLRGEKTRAGRKLNGNGGDTQFEPAVSLHDFHAYMPMPRSYIFVPNRDMWPASSVDARIPSILGQDNKPVCASAWLSQNQPVEQMTWAPGRPMLIKDRLISDGGWIERPGCTTFNLYLPPSIKPRAEDVRPWLNHVQRVFPEDADHIVCVRRQHS
jgi:hypothetical protein